jgi:RNA polymerase sigma-70 factor (ECF subfamily)
MKTSDLGLISRIVINDDHKAYGKLVLKYQSEVRGLLIKLTHGNKFLSDDLAQEVFIRAYKYLRSFKATASFSTWLYRIAYNVFLDSRKSSRETDSIENYDFLEEENKDADAIIDIQNALKVLNDNEKASVLLHYEKGFSHSEISKIMNMPLGTVKTNILRAKEKLRKYYNYEHN